MTHADQRPPSTVPNSQHPLPLIVVVMGVSGSGKSSIARQLAKDLQAHFKDGDELHPSTNIDKMSAGIPLTDDDRQPWLEEVARYAREQAAHHGICVIACSALKQRYRHILNGANSRNVTHTDTATTLNNNAEPMARNEAANVVFVFLDGSYELIASRMHLRSGHFMPKALLDSQFATLEDPRGEANVVTVNIDQAIEDISRSAIQELQQKGFYGVPQH